VYADLVKGVQQVVNGPIQGYQFNGFAADPRLLPELMLSVDTVGRPLALGQDQGSISLWVQRRDAHRLPGVLQHRGVGQVLPAG
jgi:hypothetical protein